MFDNEVKLLVLKLVVSVILMYFEFLSILVIYVGVFLKLVFGLNEIM